MTTDLEKREKQEVSTTAAEKLDHSGPAYSPDVDIHLSDDQVTFVTDLPGVSRGDVQITVDESDTLIIRAKNSHQAMEGLVACQFRIGNYYRAFQLSDDYDKDKVSATLENGLLIVNVPMKESEKPKKIQINA